jgi:hypothetical protein
MSRLGAFFRSILGLSKPAPTSAALMINTVNDWAEAKVAPQDDLLRRALVAADAPEVVAPGVVAPEVVAAELSAEPPVEARPKPVKKPAKKAAAPKKRKVPAKAAVVAAPAADDADLGDDLSDPLAASVDESGDVWFSDAVAFSLSGRWDFDGAWTPPPDAPRRLEEFREKAAEGKLTIWGRSEDVGAWQPIEAAYWRSCGIEQFSFLEGREKVFTEAKTAKAKNAKYCALKVSRHQVEEVWRGEAMH